MRVRRRLSGLGSVLGAAALLGVLQTLGDLVWALYIPDGAVVPGVVHGVIVFVALAMALGWAAGGGEATRYLLLRLPIAGVVIAGLFYPVAYLLGYLPSLLVSWVAMWLALAFFQDRAREEDGAWLDIGGRALVAALGSGLAFWAISDIWTAPPESVNYVVRFFQWTLAFLPGFAALLVRYNEAGAA